MKGVSGLSGRSSGQCPVAYSLRTLMIPVVDVRSGRSTTMAYSFMNVARQGWTRRSVRQLPLPAGVSSWSSADPEKPYSNGGKAHYIADLQMEHPRELWPMTVSPCDAILTTMTFGSTRNQCSKSGNRKAVAGTHRQRHDDQGFPAQIEGHPTNSMAQIRSMAHSIQV
jgi:hypothetical protein